MAKVELNEIIESAPEEPAQVSQVADSLLMSIAFWLILLTASLMYAAVALSPKLADWIQVRQQLASNAHRLRQLEDEADYLERVSAALKTDPEFAQRMVRASQTTDPVEVLPVAESIEQPAAPDSDETNQAPVVIQPTIHELVLHLASHHTHRSWLLGGAAGLTLFAFTLLNESGAKILRQVFLPIRRAAEMMLARYRRPVAVTVDPEPLEE